MQHVESPMMTVVRAIHDAGSITPETLADALGAPLANVLLDLRRLEDREWASRVGVDTWALTSLGLAQLGEDELSILRRHNQTLADHNARLSLEVATLRRRLSRTEAA